MKNDKSCGTCPNCGYCPCCGRSSYPYQRYPWWQPMPYQIWCDSNKGYTTSSVNISSGTAQDTTNTIAYN